MSISHVYVLLDLIEIFSKKKKTEKSIEGTTGVHFRLVKIEEGKIVKGSAANEWYRLKASREGRKEGSEG